MLFNKEQTQFKKLQKDLYRKLSEIELEVKQKELRKKVTLLIDRTFNLRPDNYKKANELIEHTLTYVKELKNELINPVELIINNYIEKIDSLLNEIKIESEE